jgi:hypothetical protein
MDFTRLVDLFLYLYSFYLFVLNTLDQSGLQTIFWILPGCLVQFSRPMRTNPSPSVDDGLISVKTRVSSAKCKQWRDTDQWDPLDHQWMAPIRSLFNRTGMRWELVIARSMTQILNNEIKSYAHNLDRTAEIKIRTGTHWMPLDHDPMV